SVRSRTDVRPIAARGSYDPVAGRAERGGGGAMKTRRLTAAQALIEFLANQYIERDGVEHGFIGGCFGIFGHGNVGGIGEALFERPDLLTYYQARNEQAMVHTAAGYEIGRASCRERV